MPSPRRLVPLSDVANIQQGKRVEHAPIAALPHAVYGANGVIGSYEAGTYDHDVVGLGCRGSVGTVHIVEAGAWLGNNVMAVWPKSDAVTLGYLALVLRTADLRGAGVISGQVQPQITRQGLSPLRIWLPSLREQKRLVDLLEAVEGVEAASRAQEAAFLQALTSFLAETAPPPGEGTAVASLLTVNLGGLWGNDPGTDAVDVAVYRSTEFTNVGQLAGVADAIRSVSMKQLLSRKLQAGDILLEKSGGTPRRPVGRVVLVRDKDLTAGQAIYANFLQLLRPESSVVDGSFLFWTLWSWHRQGLPERFQQASTNIRNLRTPDYLAQQISLPDPPKQAEVVGVADAIYETMLCAREAAAAAAHLRQALVQDLMTGQGVIPDSYDTLLELGS